MWFTRSSLCLYVYVSSMVILTFIFTNDFLELLDLWWIFPSGAMEYHTVIYCIKIWCFFHMFAVLHYFALCEPPGDFYCHTV